MLILTIRTDKPEAEIGLYKNEQKLEYKTWLAHRELAETIHQKIREILNLHGKQLHDIQGIVVFKGPGSFTGLRIGVSVANALATGLKAGVVAANDSSWQQTGIKQLHEAMEHGPVLPEYGSAAHTTSQK